MKRILLTGARAPATLDLVRHFHRAGHEVYLADSIQLPLARLTRFAKKTFVVSKPAIKPVKFVEDLAVIVSRYKIDLLLPTCEEIFYLSAHLHLFPSSVSVFSEPLARLQVLHNKWTFTQLIQKLDCPIRAPETHLISNPGELAVFIGDIEPDQWVFKPVFSRFAARTLIGPTIEKLRTITPSNGDPWVVQRRIKGNEFSTYSIANRGRLRAHSCYRSKYRAGLGSGIYFLAVDDVRIRDFVEVFVTQLDFTGQLGFDFMQDCNGKLHVLECNPRATSGVHMLDRQPIADAFLSSDGPLLEQLTSRPAMLAAVMFLFPLPVAIRQGGVGTLFRDMLAARDVMFSWNDPLPSLLSPLTLIEVLLTAIRTRRLLTQAATFDIEWNGEPM